MTKLPECIVHTVRNSTKFVSYKDLKAVCADLKGIYPAPSEEAGRAALEEFGEKWQAKYPLIYQSWGSNWPDLCEFFNYPEEIRRVIYRTNALESLNYPLWKVPRNRSVLARDEAIHKIMYLALRNAAKNGLCRLRSGEPLSTSLHCFLASGFRSYEFYSHKTIDRPRVGLFQRNGDIFIEIESMYDGTQWLDRFGKGTGAWFIRYGIHATIQRTDTLNGFDTSSDITIPVLPTENLGTVTK